jgi:DNA (cytosine-5)-methyltransferase 1
MLRHVDLCSGIGGFSLGFHWAELSKPILFCDTEEWCRKILAKNFPNVPIAKDVKELANDPERLVPDHDILSCGYPCQPFSVAGLRKAEKDDRHIWPSIFRIIAQKRPSWVVCENVYGHIALGLDKVLLDLESEEYATRTFVVPACAKNAPHRRDRLWIIAKNVANTESQRTRKDDQRLWERSERTGRGEGTTSTKITQSIMGDTEYNGSSSTEIRGSNEEDARGSQKGEIQTEQFEGASGRANHETMADTNCERLQGSEETRNIEECRTDSNQFSTRHGGTSDVADTNCQRTSRRKNMAGSNAKDVRQSSRFGEDKNIWFVEPNVGRVAHGVSKRVDRLKGLGNAIVPQIAMQIGLAIKNERS